MTAWSIRFTFISLLIVFSFWTQAQVRFGLQTGMNSITEEGFTSQLKTTLSLGWKFENELSWGIQYGTTVRTQIKGTANYKYCDSIVQAGWSQRCAGNDSVVNSNFTQTFNANSLSVYIVKHRQLCNEKFDLAGGLLLSSHFLSRREQRLDALLHYDNTDKAIAGSLSPIIRFSYRPIPKKSDFSIFVEGSSGIFISPQQRCEDANCDNFLEQAYNSNTIVQIGISY